MKILQKYYSKFLNISLPNNKKSFPFSREAFIILTFIVNLSREYTHIRIAYRYTVER